MWCPVHRTWACDCRLAVRLACALALLVGCASVPALEPCSATDVAGAAKALECREAIARDCPADQPLESCPTYLECSAWGKERCE